ncbi:pentatricopeptide repeat-containing protein [Pyrus ussuriensis x Pyrus communis]|uniref:Pentatricopeptide repeat-containing protein n=1 Tax=Pyrus ussuriensis x Pyrus communis TaxID=2448454 RepID=A0A5N5H8Z3_9ROSA|nr:pentatricopeptide repeat-containing protein [Pyrus ussuriensis x Pyrus communis]
MVKPKQWSFEQRIVNQHFDHLSQKVNPHISTCLQLLEKCRNVRHLQQAHAQVFTSGLGSNSFAVSRLLAFCSDPRHGSLSHDWNLEALPTHPTAHNLLLKHNVLQNGMCPDNYTLPYLLKACARMQRCRLGELIHGFCLKLGFVSDIFVGNSLIVMYCAFDNVKRALYVFDEMPSLSLVSWKVMISGFAKVGSLDMARLFFDEAPDTEPDEAIFVSVLCACAHLGALDSGIWIHSYLNRLRLRLSVRLTTGLIDMYAKCGRLELASGLFDEMLQRDMVVRPDDGYTHEPKSEHYRCIVDLLCRAGFFEEAKETIQSIPTWRAFHLECHIGVYVLLSNLHAASREHRVEKASGCSSVEINRAVHESIADSS